ncbi:small-conductance mechanosensitive channel [Sphingobacterium allocomposti]|uniref:Small-conductance mechanosensitive channel n=1 Tax=Sphingobacterium allocomposti TaxID=415956 RepID=A0A5S5DIB4_9SPHI|nr:mechanosensitive ion channel domain-containing protein [Sphingobacterium composti Yoo et al. 2007 non Ten et al. 2007]TYP95723.1 small-conductance mechanosensitive channel [Sphingobacterium composti Yoo et al. 2007 non Ten et al. 2007]
MAERKNHRNTWQFVLKLVAWMILNASFFYFEDLYSSRRVINNLSNGLNLFLTSSILFSIARYVVITWYNKRHENRDVRGNFVLGINRLTAVLNTSVGIIAIMLALGIDPLNFITSLTIVAMAIAVIFREYITNMISGLFIMFSDQLSVGDRVKVGEYRGRIVDITLSALIIQDEEDDMVMVPNNTVFTSPMVNFSAHRSSLFSVKFELPLHTAVEIDKLEETIQKTLLNHPYLTGEDDLHLKVVEIGKDYVKYKMEMHATSSSSRLHRQLENEVLREVLKFERTSKEI